MTRTKLLIIDDRESVCQALEARLGKAPEIELVGSTGSSQDGIRLVGEKKPDVVLLEVKIADGSGLETCRQIVAGGTSVIILTSYLDEAERQAAFEVGASRYVLKNIDSERLIKAIQAVRSDQMRR